MCQTPELPDGGDTADAFAWMDGENRAQEFGEYLRELRKARGLTQERLGELAQVDPTTISKWERGRRLPERVDGVETLARVTAVLHDKEHELARLAGVTLPNAPDRRNRPAFRRLIVTEKTLRSTRQRQLMLTFYETLIGESPEP